MIKRVGDVRYLEYHQGDVMEVGCIKNNQTSDGKSRYFIRIICDYSSWLRLSFNQFIFHVSAKSHTTSAFLMIGRHFVPLLTAPTRLFNSFFVTRPQKFSCRVAQGFLWYTAFVSLLVTLYRHFVGDTTGRWL